MYRHNLIYMYESKVGVLWIYVSTSVNAQI